MKAEHARIVEAKPLLDSGYAGCALGFEAESGDAHLVCERGDRAVVAVIDGLGHGPEAALAARAAVRSVRENADAAVDVLFKCCHESLRSTRGAVMSLAIIDGTNGTLTWAGIGNVEGLLIRGQAGNNRPNECLLLRGGVVGFRLPPLKISTISILPGDTLIFATDGVGREFGRALDVSGSPSEIADYVLRRYATKRDDALVLVSRYLGRRT